MAVDDLTFKVTPGVVTGFLGPNGSGKSTTMRMIMGLDLPDAGSATVNGVPYEDLRWPLREVGALLDAKAFHPGRSARDHLTWLAQTNDLPAGACRRGARPRRPHRRGRTSGPGSSRSAWGSASASPARSSATRACCSSTSPSTASTPRASAGSATCSATWPRQGRTVLVSSHLITEMSLTAERLVVIGRGSLIAETSVDEFIAPNAAESVRIVTPTPQRFVAALHRVGARPDRGRRGHRRHRDALGGHRRAGRRPVARPCTSSPPCGRRSRTPSWSSPATAWSTAPPAPSSVPRRPPFRSR